MSGLIRDWPKIGDRMTQPFLDQLMVSQLLEQNLTLGFFLKGLNGPPGPPGASDPPPQDVDAGMIGEDSVMIGESSGTTESSAPGPPTSDDPSSPGST